MFRGFVSTRQEKSVSGLTNIGALALFAAITPALADGPQAELEALRKQVREYQRQLQEFDRRLQAQESRNAEPVVHNEETQQPPQSAVSPKPQEVTATDRFSLKAKYKNGFSLSTDDNRFSFNVGALAIGRYTLDAPTRDTKVTNRFDLFLGRLYLYGTAFDPRLSYFFHYQTTTLANNNAVSTIDWFLNYSWDSITAKAGRFYPAYSRQFYNDIGKYLFPDLDEVEYAFSLQRTPGAEVTYRTGPLLFSFTGGNSVRGLDAVGEGNNNLKIAGIARVNLDILDPYAYGEETSPQGVDHPQLSIGGAFAFNPIDSSSALQNVQPGDDTLNATVDFGYRYRRFTTQAALFWRQVNHTINRAIPNSDDFGYYWQAGYYLIPGRLELGGRVSGTHFNDPNGNPTRDSTRYGGVLNYYFYDHHFKIQADYTHTDNDLFDTSSRTDDRLRVQTQLYF